MFLPIGVEIGIDDCQREQQNPQGGRNPVAEQRQHAHRERDVGRHRYAPTGLSSRTSIQTVVDHRRRDHAAERRHQGKRRPSDIGELALIDFAMNNFQGLPYDRATGKQTDTQRDTVGNLLLREGDLYVGIKAGRGGVVCSAWRNQAFLKEEVNVTDDASRGWQYLSLKDFKTLAQWAMNPEEKNLQGMEWSGKPFAI